MTTDNNTPETPPISASSGHGNGLKRRHWIVPVGIAAASAGLIAATVGVTALALDEWDDDDGGVGTSTSGEATQADVNGKPTATTPEFEDARDAAVRAAGGGSLVELDRELGGWSGEVRLDDGSTNRCQA